ncbi:MAG TPA: Cof-type HAD-IIB family hydrolase [Bacillales bacterium]|nr:Cof-type HAD-IIB family hydrolase [Bacillales bacterium]
MPKYKLLALDLDGTLLTDEKEISQNTKIWIRRAVQEGVTVIFATGRGWPRTERYWKELNLLDSPMVLLNGAELWKWPGELLKRHFIDPKDIRWLYHLAMSKEAGFWGYNIEGFVRKPNWTKEMFHQKWMKFGIRHENPIVAAELKEQIAMRPGLEVVSSSTNSMEISLRGITKESGTRDIVEFLGIEMEDVMAVGDSPNDLRLIRAAGLGVAMGNAVEEVKEAADRMTASNNQDGVAEAIQRYLFGYRQELPLIEETRLGEL